MMRPLILAAMFAAVTGISLHPLEKGGPGPDVSRLERLEGGEKMLCCVTHFFRVHQPTFCD